MGKLKHGDNVTGKRTKLYQLWSGMRARCRDPKHISYRHYGARGITVCDAWHDYTVFREWALSHGYREGLWLERKDSDGQYCPENCEWIEPKENVRRAHAGRRFKRYVIFGEAKTMGEWVEDERCQCSYYTLRNRIQRGWGLEEALTTPTKSASDKRRAKGELVARIPSLRR
jgi:hypothetical protein